MHLKNKRSKIAIHTIVSLNYGNRLQNFALQEVLKSIGYDVFTIRNKPDWISKIKRIIRPILKNDMVCRFNEFDKKIKWTNCYVNKDSYSKNLEEKFDAFVIGSDQIWNLTFNFIGQNDFLPFINKKRKIAYSASFGIDKLEKDVEETSKNLMKIDYISVREESGVRLINNLIKCKVDLLMDPTMLLTASEWDRVSKRPKNYIDENYIFVYFLGEITDERKKYINYISDRFNLKIYNILENSSMNGPSEFLYLISHSKVILTDSFHACVFSILFDKPFLVFDRLSSDKPMNSRIATLTSKFGLERKYFQGKNYVYDDSIFECNYLKKNEILFEERDKSKKFLLNALKGI